MTIPGDSVSAPAVGLFLAGLLDRVSETRYRFANAPPRSISPLE
jgi:hypothetical protein